MCCNNRHNPGLSQANRDAWLAYSLKYSLKFENYEKLSSIFKNEGNLLLKFTTLAHLKRRGDFLLPCPQSQGLIVKSTAKEQTATKMKQNKIEFNLALPPLPQCRFIRAKGMDKCTITGLSFALASNSMESQ